MKNHIIQSDFKHKASLKLPMIWTRLATPFIFLEIEAKLKFPYWSVDHYPLLTHLFPLLCKIHHDSISLPELELTEIFFKNEMSVLHTLGIKTEDGVTFPTAYLSSNEHKLCIGWPFCSRAFLESSFEKLPLYDTIQPSLTWPILCMSAT